MLDDNLNKNQSSSAETKSFLLGNTINELNENLIQSRKDEAEQKNTWFDNKTSPIKVQSASSTTDASTTDASTIDPLTKDSVNWNQLRVLFNEDNTVLTKKVLKMLKTNTNLAEKEICDWHAGILRDCPNGKLSKDQFVAAYEHLYPNGKAKDFCKYAFATFDRDNIGTSKNKFKYYYS